MAEHLRQVIREHRFERELRALVRDAIEADRFVEAAEFLLVRNPQIGFQVAAIHLSGSCQWRRWGMPKSHFITPLTIQPFGCCRSDG